MNLDERVRASIRARFSTELGVELCASNDRHLAIMPLDISEHSASVVFGEANQELDCSQRNGRLPGTLSNNAGQWIVSETGCDF
jgi:hypothetical protein